jgi:hypothetical protein
MPKVGFHNLCHAYGAVTICPLAERYCAIQVAFESTKRGSPQRTVTICAFIAQILRTAADICQAAYDPPRQNRLRHTVSVFYTKSKSCGQNFP